MSNTPQSTIPEGAKGILDIGNHCSFCNTVDFLPFKCDDCGHTFCSSHRLPHAHECSHSLATERQRLKDLKVTSTIPKPATAGRTIGSSAKGPVTGPQRTAVVRQQLAEQQQRVREKETAADARSKNNMAALDKLRSIWGSSTSSKPATATNKPAAAAKPKYTIPKKETVGAQPQTSAASKWFGKLGGGSTTQSSSSGASAAKITASALLQLKREAKPLDAARPSNTAINGAAGATANGTTPGRRYVVLVAHGSVVGPYQPESSLRETAERRESHSATVYMARNITIGKVVDRATDLLRVPRTRKDEDGTERRAALFLEGEMLPYNSALDKALNGAVKDGDRLTIKYI